MSRRNQTMPSKPGRPPDSHCPGTGIVGQSLSSSSGRDCGGPTESASAARSAATLAWRTANRSRVSACVVRARSRAASSDCRCASGNRGSTSSRATGVVHGSMRVPPHEEAMMPTGTSSSRCRRRAK